MSSDVILQLSDLHLGCVIKPAQVNGWNAFDREIAEDRLQVLAKHVGLVLGKMEQKWSTFHLVLGGDLIHGERHEVDTNDLTLEDQRSEAVALLGDTIGRLQAIAYDMGKVPMEIHAVVGNHGEYGGPKQPVKDIYGRNVEWGVYLQLAELTARSALVPTEWNLAEGAEASFRSQGLNFRVIHGHTLGPRTAALSSIERAVEKRLRQAKSAGAEADHLLIHHFHRPTIHTSFTVNGALCGFDELAMARGWEWTAPQQVMTLVHPWWGVYQRNMIHATAEGSSVL